MSRRLLLSLGLIGATFTGHTPHLFPTTQDAPIPPEELREPLGTSWIPGLGLSEPAKASNPSTADAESAVVRLVTLRPEDVPLLNFPPGASDKEPASDPLPPGDVVWVQVLRAARVHSGPSVSAPTVRFYRVGTGLHMIDYQRGWFQVSDPATAQRGWIYEKYLGALSAPVELQAAVEQPEGSTRVEESKPIRPVARAKAHRLPARERRERPETIASSVQAERSRPPPQEESVANLLQKALRGY